MSDFLGGLLRRSQRHLSDEELLRLMDGELSGSAARRIQQHLECCWGCRGRYEEVQATIFRFVDYRKQVAAPYLPPPPGGRDRFLRKLDEVMLDSKIPLASRIASYLRSLMASVARPVVASVFAAVVAVAAVILLWQQTSQTVSANELLEKAAISDQHATTDGRQGVIYQKIQIRSATGTVERTVYRDAEGRRKPRAIASDTSSKQLEKTLELGGVNLQQPLSAEDFRSWHDHLQDKKDRVRHETGILTLTTSTDSSEVKEESITVRDTDFHPTARRLVLRDSGEIEISELNFAVLGWDQINAGPLFEDPGPPAPATSQSAVRLPVLPTIAALDEAELRARLALNRAHADRGEQIAVTQSPSSIRVTGVVENEARKKQLQDSLRGIPLVTPSIQTFADLAQHISIDDTQASRIEEHSLVAQESPLEGYLTAKSVPRETAVALSQELFDAALTIQRESLALNALDKRFSALERSRLDPAGLALLQELLKRHRSSLAAAIADEKSLAGPYVAPADAQADIGSRVAPYTNEDLLGAATQNKKLCDELLATGSQDKRPGEQILAEMIRSLEHLNAIAVDLDGSSRPVSGIAPRNP